MIRKVRTNISKELADLGFYATGGKKGGGKENIYRKAGKQLSEALLEEFEVLVRETPQWTGTTAASWEIGFQSDITDGVEEQPSRTREEALSKGSEVACNIAMGKAYANITPDFSKYIRESIIVSNNAPGFDRAEEGPVRPVNTPPGALERFKARIAIMDLEVDLLK